MIPSQSGFHLGQIKVIWRPPVSRGLAGGLIDVSRITWSNIGYCPNWGFGFVWKDMLICFWADLSPVLVFRTFCLRCFQDNSSDYTKYCGLIPINPTYNFSTQTTGVTEPARS